MCDMRCTIPTTEISKSQTSAAERRTLLKKYLVRRTFSEQRAHSDEDFYDTPGGSYVHGRYRKILIMNYSKQNLASIVSVGTGSGAW